MIKRILAFLLTAVLLTGLLAGCGDETDTAQTEQSDTAKYAYKVDYLDLNVDDAYQLSYINGSCFLGNQLFFSGSCVTGKEVYTNEITGETVIDEETGEPLEIDIYEDTIFRYDLDTGECVRLENFQETAVPEGMLGNTNLSAMAASADGTFWIVESVYTYSYDLPEDFNAETDDAWNYYVPGETLKIMRQFDTDGNELKSVDCSVLGEDYLNQVLVDESGTIYINTYETVYLLDAEGTLLGQLTNDNWSSLYQISPSEIGVVTYDETVEGSVFKVIDPAAQDYGETIQLPSNASRLYMGIEPYWYLYDSYGDVVYGYNQETETSEKLFSWLDCDVNSDSFDEFSILDDGRIVALTRDYTKTPTKYELVCMEQVDASTLPQKQELTLACMYLSQDIRNEVIDFNKSHDDVRITVKDYSEYNTDEDYTAGLTKLNTEILSGTVPDILDTSGLPVDQYAAKGVLADLWPLIDGDSELSREDLMTHLFDVLSIDGKLYQITDSFTIQTAVGNADVIGDRTSWTLDELLETMESLPEGATIFGETDTKDGILSSCVSRNIDSFINWEEKTCSFDSQEFIDLLNFANSFPAEFDWDNYDWETSESTYSRFQTGKQLLMDAWLYEFGYMQMLSALVGGNPAYVGYPSVDGNGSVFALGDSLAITAACQDIDLAWTFVRTFLTEDYQTSDYMWNFPTNRHSFDTLVEREMTPEYTTDPETGEQVEVSTMSWGMDDLTIEVYAMTQEEYDTFLRLYESCSSIYTSNNTVYEIIQEEAAAFFDGQKTAEETAALIQDRVGLYVMEQG